MNYVFVLLLLTATARAHPDGAWKWGESADKPNTDAPTQLAVAGKIIFKKFFMNI